MLIERDVARVVPAITEDAAIDVVSDVHIFHAIHKRLVVIVTAQLIAEE